VLPSPRVPFAHLPPASKSVEVHIYARMAWRMPVVPGVHVNNGDACRGVGVRSQDRLRIERAAAAPVNSQGLHARPHRTLCP